MAAHFAVFPRDRFGNALATDAFDAAAGGDGTGSVLGASVRLLLLATRYSRFLN